ncbi:ZDHHC9, partial [Symbiodinium microadriaticum]
TLQKNPGPLIVAVFALFAVLSLQSLCGYHVFLVWHGQTTNEQLREVYRDRPNPYDHGPIANCRSICCAAVPPSSLPDMSTMMSDYHYLRACHDVSEGLMARGQGGVGGGGGRQYSECSFDSTTTTNTRSGGSALLVHDDSSVSQGPRNSGLGSRDVSISTGEEGLVSTRPPFHAQAVHSGGGDALLSIYEPDVSQV